MPVYVYECPVEHRTELFAPVAEHRSVIQCSCGKDAQQLMLACAIHTIATFSRSIDDQDVQKSVACDGSYLDPTLSFHPETGKVVAPITSERQRQKLMAERGLFEKAPSEKAKDVQRLKKTKPIHFV
jgi:hypothetical protein